MIATHTMAQTPTQTIRGTVTDKQSGSPLPGATVLLVDSTQTLGTTSDVEGRYRLEGVPLGRQTLRIGFIGYHTVTLSTLSVLAGKELEVNAQLEEKITELQEVEITNERDEREALNKMATVSTRTFSVEEAGRYAGSLLDPARMAQNYAGISSASDDRNDIIIRGNSPTGVLWRLEGIAIPSPNHFSTVGTTGGPISMLNINNLSNSDLTTSAWTADLGNATSGVFDLRLRNGNRDEREYLGQIGLNGFELGLEGPFKRGRRGTYLVNYRYSTLGVFTALGIDLGTGSAVPDYQDITFKFDMPTEKAGRFGLFGIGGVSDIEFEAEGQDSTNLFNDANEASMLVSQTGVIGASHTYFFNTTTSSRLVLAASTAVVQARVDSVSEDQVKHRQFGLDNQQHKLSADWRLNKKLNAKNTVTLGAVFDRYLFDVVDSARSDAGIIEYIRDFDGHGDLLQCYLAWQHRFSERTTLNLGLHDQHFLMNGSFAVEPRLGFKHKVNAQHTLNIGAGLHSQLQPLPVYFSRDPYLPDPHPNRHLGMTHALHTVLGYDLFIGTHVRLKSELYYQYLYNVAVDTVSSSFSMLNEGADFGITDRTGLDNNGSGSNQGVELTLERFYSRGYYYLATVSLFDSKYQGSDGVERNTVFNGAYVLNALAGREWQPGKKSTLAFDTKLTYAGGRRFTPIDLEASRTFGTEVRIESRAFEGRYNDYFRADVKITYRRNGKRITQTFSLDLQNITGNRNVFQRNFSETTGEIETTYQRGFFPVMLYTILF